MHLLIFGGFLMLLVGPALDTVNEHFYHFLEGNIYLGVSLMLDLGGFLVLAGLGMAAYRRYVMRPSKLNNVFDDGMTLGLLAAIIITGYLVEGFRLAGSGDISEHVNWSAWSPGGFVVAKIFSPLGESANLRLHQVFWWGHMGISMGGMAYVFLSFSKLSHAFASPMNMFMRTQPAAKGIIRPIEISEESMGALGASKLQDLTWKDLVDFDACTRCGRCEEVCPANKTGKPLSPKMVIQKLKAHMVQQAPALLSGKKAEGDGSEVPLLGGGVVSEDEIWACTTCGACEEACPVYVEPITKIVQMRQNLVLEQGVIPATMMASLRSVQDRGHPWKGASASRTDWCQGIEIKNLANEGGDAEFLFWVGCTEAVNESSMSIPAALARIVQGAGIKLSTLGHEESCCGHMARRIGDEYLFQCQAQANIEVMKSHNVKKIITACPHCYHTLKYEYSQFGGDFEVVHHTEFLLQLIKDGKLKLDRLEKTVAYQDPCYLGRYHNIYEAPRKLLRSIPGLKLVEMEGCRGNSLCCGAGGGRMWMEEEPEQRVNGLRAKHAAATHADIVLTACPFCLQMMKDGLGGLGMEEPPEVIDLVELLERVVLVPTQAATAAAAGKNGEKVSGQEVLSGISEN